MLAGLQGAGKTTSGPKLAKLLAAQAVLDGNSGQCGCLSSGGY